MVSVYPFFFFARSLAPVVLFWFFTGLMTNSPIMMIYDSINLTHPGGGVRFCVAFGTTLHKPPKRLGNGTKASSITTVDKE